jgi:phage terminase large subunit-like protein
MLWRFWLPEAWVAKRPNHPLTEWARQGWIKITDGDVIDFDTIQRQVEKDAERFNILELGHDPWQSTQMIQALADQGMVTAKVTQGIATLTDPTKELERLVAAGLFNHNNNPVARWMVDNVTLKTIGDQVKPEKAKSMDKIDGVMAAVFGLERGLRAEPVADPAVSWL